MLYYSMISRQDAKRRRFDLPGGPMMPSRVLQLEACLSTGRDRSPVEIRINIRDYE